MLVESQGLGVVGDGAAVDYRLALVFTGILQLRDVEQAVGGGEEVDRRSRPGGSGAGPRARASPP